MMPVSINNGYVMRAWYDVREADLHARADLPGIRRSQAQVEALIARERARGVADARIVLAGFSQGGAIALYAGLRHADAPGRHRGAVHLPHRRAGARRRGVRRQSRRAHLHGARHVRSGGAARLGGVSRAALAAGGWSVEWHEYPMEHSAVLEEMAAVGAFLRRVL